MALGKDSDQRAYAERGSQLLTQLTDEASLISSVAPFTFGKVATALDDFCTELRRVLAPACLPSFPLQGRPWGMQPIRPMAAELCRGVRGRERPCCSPPPTLAQVRGTDDLLFRVLLLMFLPSSVPSHASTVCMFACTETERPIGGR